MQTPHTQNSFLGSILASCQISLKLTNLEKHQSLVLELNFSQSFVKSQNTTVMSIKFIPPQSSVITNKCDLYVCLLKIILVVFMCQHVYQNWNLTSQTFSLFLAKTNKFGQHSENGPLIWYVNPEHWDLLSLSYSIYIELWQ